MDMGVCTFSIDASKADRLPVGLVRYPVTRASVAEDIYLE